MIHLVDALWVGLGGGVGTLLRWQVGKLVGERYQGGFPLATFLVNISGALCIGFFSVYFSTHWPGRSGATLNAGLLTGVLGGYTTFSTLMLDALKLDEIEERGLALVYVVMSVVLGLIAAWLGAVLAGES